MACDRTFVSRDPVVASWGKHFKDFPAFRRWVMQTIPFDPTAIDGLEGDWCTLGEYADAIAATFGVRLGLEGDDDDAG